MCSNLELESVIENLNSFLPSYSDLEWPKRKENDVKEHRKDKSPAKYASYNMKTRG